MAVKMEYWYLWVIFALLCVLTLFVMSKASKALKKHNSEKNDVYEQLKRLKAMKDEFINLTQEKAEGEDAKRLFEGVMAVIQYEIEKSDDAEKLFREYPESKKAVYVVNYIFEDGEKGLSEFFKRNGEPLISCTEKALLTIGETELSNIAKDEFTMFDENNEDVSIDPEVLEALDDQFSNIFDRERLLTGLKSVVTQNIADFQTKALI